jgi:hypothetical protein
MAGIGVSDANHVTLYDDTLMRAFGPVFSSGDHAEDFLTWLRDRTNGQIDLRRVHRDTLDSLHELWLDMRCDEDGDLLPQPERTT